MTRSFLSLLIVSCLMVNLATSTILNFPTLSGLTLKKVFDSVKPYTDLSNAFYSIKGLELIGELPQNSQEICNLVKSKVDKNSLESVYYAVSVTALLKDCTLSTGDFTPALNNAASSTNVPDSYYYSLISKQLNLPIDSNKLSKNVLDGLKTDSSVLNQAFSLHIATLLTENDKVFYDNIEDILDQADEVDKKYLQYEGGVGTTSLVLEGILSLSEKFQQLPAKFDQQRLTKFVNYLSAKRYPTNIKSAYFLLRNAIKLTNNQFLIPLVLNRISPVGISAAQPNVLVSVTNILGGAVKDTQFVLEAESAKSEKATLLAAKKAFTPKSSDGTAFELQLIEAGQKVSADFYVITVTASPKQADKRFFLLQNKLQVKVSNGISVVDLQIGVADRDQSVPKLVKVEENKKLATKLEADQTSKFFVKFSVKDNAKNAMIETHQAFVKFTELKSGREIVFLAQAGLNNLYTAEIDLSSNAKNFRHTSGNYKVELAVADALVENPISWELAEVKLQFNDEQSAASAPQDKLSQFSKRPEIEHLFRQPEPTPSKIVSTVFALLCVLPLGVMLILWFTIGFNLSRLRIDVSSIVFHVSLAAIFGLFVCYWVDLNMFQTLRYLALLGLVAFISGSKLLKSLAAEKEKKN